MGIVVKRIQGMVGMCLVLMVAPSRMRGKGSHLQDEYRDGGCDTNLGKRVYAGIWHNVTLHHSDLGHIVCHH